MTSIEFSTLTGKFLAEAINLLRCINDELDGENGLHSPDEILFNTINLFKSAAFNKNLPPNQYGSDFQSIIEELAELRNDNLFLDRVSDKIPNFRLSVWKKHNNLCALNLCTLFSTERISKMPIDIIGIKVLYYTSSSQARQSRELTNIGVLALPNKLLEDSNTLSSILYSLRLVSGDISINFYDNSFAVNDSKGGWRTFYYIDELEGRKLFFSRRVRKIYPTNNSTKINVRGLVRLGEAAIA